MARTSTERISADERREQILDAAIAVFGEQGYAGATTDRVARAAGISQPYVVRLFGTKEQLFVAALRRTMARVIGAFREALGREDGRSAEQRLGEAYVLLMEDRGVLLTMLHGFMLGGDPVIGPVAREGFLEIFRMLRDEAHFSPDQIHRFLADGMLINTLLASGIARSVPSDRDAANLMECTFGEQVTEALSRASA